MLLIAPGEPQCGILEDLGGSWRIWEDRCSQPSKVVAGNDIYKHMRNVDKDKKLHSIFWVILIVLQLACVFSH